MARRDQPYLPLYVQDFMTDEKLAECSATATGVYIRLMCLMHKSEQYGKILLKQKDKQTDKQIENFALKLAKHLPYDLDTIRTGITELLDEDVIQIEEDCLYQKRMVRDCELSEKRAVSGQNGGKKTQKKVSDFALAKVEANTENEIENETHSISTDIIPDSTVQDTTKQDNKLDKGKGKKKFVPPTVNEVRAYCEERKNSVDAEAFVGFYQSKGWMVGSNPMKDWKASVITWEKRNRGPTDKQPKESYISHNERVARELGVIP